jgi:hypothetical protein
MAARTKTKPQTDDLDLPRLEVVAVDFEQIVVPIVGTAPLVAHKWDVKVASSIIPVGEKGKEPTKKKAPKNPEAEYQSARYLLPNGTDGFPATAFKSAIIQGARAFERNQITMAALKPAIFIFGEGPDSLVPLELEAPPVCWQANPRIGQGQADVRYRPKYWPWRATLHIEFVQQLVTRQQLLALVEFGGRGGVGEWRPSSPKSLTGHLGTFRIDPDRAVYSVEV